MYPATILTIIWRNIKFPASCLYSRMIPYNLMISIDSSILFDLKIFGNMQHEKCIIIIRYQFISCLNMLRVIIVCTLFSLSQAATSVMTDAGTVTHEQKNKCTIKDRSFVSMENAVSLMEAFGAAFIELRNRKLKELLQTLKTGEHLFKNLMLPSDYSHEPNVQF